MVLFKKVDGKDIQLDEKEELEIRALWAENEKKSLEEEERVKRSFLLVSKYKDPYEAIDKICQHLKIDFSTLEESSGEK